jgi:tetratricopeptide (TPR) repeat protein
VLALLVALSGGSADAQLLGSRTEAHDCASAIGGNVEGSTISIVCGIPSEQAVELVRLAASPQMGDRAELLRRLDAMIPATSRLRAEALARFFVTLGEAAVESEQIESKLVEIAERHRALEERLAVLESADPAVNALRERAAEAVKSGAYDEAERLLEQAEAADLAMARAARDLERQAKAAADSRYLSAAGTRAALGDLALTRLDYRGAAERFAQAAELVPEGHNEERAGYRFRQADALSEHGDQKGENPALIEAIAVYREVGAFYTRERAPLAGAMTQSNLGLALQTLGGREAGTARLEEAVAAYRAALDLFERAGADHYVGIAQRNLRRIEDLLTKRQAEARG